MQIRPDATSVLRPVVVLGPELTSTLGAGGATPPRSQMLTPWGKPGGHQACPDRLRTGRSAQPGVPRVVWPKFLSLRSGASRGRCIPPTMTRAFVVVSNVGRPSGCQALDGSDEGGQCGTEAGRGIGGKHRKTVQHQVSRTSPAGTMQVFLDVR